MKPVNRGMFTSLFYNDTNLFVAESKMNKYLKKKLAGLNGSHVTKIYVNYWRLLTILKSADSSWRSNSFSKVLLKKILDDSPQRLEVLTRHLSQEFPHAVTFESPFHATNLTNCHTATNHCCRHKMTVPESTVFWRRAVQLDIMYSSTTTCS